GAREARLPGRGVGEGRLQAAELLRRRALHEVPRRELLEEPPGARGADAAHRRVELEGAARADLDALGQGLGELARPEALPRALARLRGLDLAVARRAGRDEVPEEAPRDRGDPRDGLLEGAVVRLRGRPG